MTVEQLFAALLVAFPALANAGKIFFDHIEVTDGEEITPPYMVLTETEQDPFFADDTVYYLTIRHTLELYTVTYDAPFIDRVERFFNDHQIPFALSVEWRDELDMYDATFEVQLDKSEVES